MTRDEAYIAQRCAAENVAVLYPSDNFSRPLRPGLIGPVMPDRAAILGCFGAHMLAHDEPLPFRRGWRDRVVAHFQQERERA